MSMWLLSVCITRISLWGHHQLGSLCHWTQEAICFGCLAIAVPLASATWKMLEFHGYLSLLRKQITPLSSKHVRFLTLFSCNSALTQSIPLNLYSPNASSTSSSIRCSDKRCFASKGCSSPSSICPYELSYSPGTATTGTLLQDVLHLAKEDVDLEPVKANVTLG